MTKRYLGVDYGSRRIGLAIADEGVKVARPWRILEADNGAVVEQLRRLVAAEKITDIILGLPRSLDGNDTAQTESVRRFGDELKALGCPLVLQDEADTSQVARGRVPKQRRVDAEAAAIILQDYLESQ